METKNFGYSLKNIPIPTKSNYLKSMVEKVESFIRRLRWKAYFFCKDAKRYDNASANSFRFKSLATPPQNEHLKAFEDDIYEMISSNLQMLEMTFKRNFKAIFKVFSHPINCLFLLTKTQTYTN